MGTLVVTGSASGIGAALRRQLEAEGHRVIGVDLEQAEVAADLSTVAGRAKAVRQSLEAAGGKLDGFVACAGVGPTAGSSSLIVSVNYFGAVELLDGFADALSTSGSASAVVVCSNSATTVPDLPEDLIAAMLDDDEGSARWNAESVDGTTAYATSKLALSRAVRRRAPRWAERGVRLNGVAPGAVETPLLRETLEDETLGPAVRAFPIPAGSFGKPEQIAAMISFLLGPQASFCVGSIVFIDGGTDALLRPDRF